MICFSVSSLAEVKLSKPVSTGKTRFTGVINFILDHISKDCSIQSILRRDSGYGFSSNIRISGGTFLGHFNRILVGSYYLVRGLRITDNMHGKAEP